MGRRRGGLKNPYGFKYIIKFCSVIERNLEMSGTMQTPELTWHSFTTVAPSEWRQEYLAEIQSFSAGANTIPESVVMNYSLSQYLRDARNFTVGVVCTITPVISEEELEKHAVDALTVLVKQNPLSLPLLITAIEEGRIDGSTYYGASYYDTTSPRCIVGWVKIAVKARSAHSPCLHVEGRDHLEDYVTDIRRGETHLTNKRLAVLYAALISMDVDSDTTKDVVIVPVEESTCLILEHTSRQSYRNTDDSTETSFPYRIKQLVGSCSLT